MKEKFGRVKELVNIIGARAGVKNVSLQQYLNNQWVDSNETGYVKIEGVINQYRIIGEKDKEITQFKLGQLHGCCGVCVSFNVSVNEKFRKKGINILGNKLRQEIARLCDYTVILCTDVDGNLAQERTLLREGWQKVFYFINNRTKNKVNISIKHL